MDMDRSVPADLIGCIRLCCRIGGKQMLKYYACLIVRFGYNTIASLLEQACRHPLRRFIPEACPSVIVCHRAPEGESGGSGDILCPVVAQRGDSPLRLREHDAESFASDSDIRIPVYNLQRLSLIESFPFDLLDVLPKTDLMPLICPGRILFQPDRYFIHILSRMIHAWILHLHIPGGARHNFLFHFLLKQAGSLTHDPAYKDIAPGGKE